MIKDYEMLMSLSRQENQFLCWFKGFSSEKFWISFVQFIGNNSKLVVKYTKVMVTLCGLLIRNKIELNVIF